MSQPNRVVSRRFPTMLALIAFCAILVNGVVQSLYAQIQTSGLFNKSTCSPQGQANCKDCKKYYLDSPNCVLGFKGCFATKCDNDKALVSRQCLTYTSTCATVNGFDTTTCFDCKDWDCGCLGDAACPNCTCSATANPTFTYPTWSKWPLCQ